MSVVEFPGPKQDDRYWVCACSCSSFELHANGEPYCCACGSQVSEAAGGGWHARVAEEADREDDEPPFKVTQIEDGHFTRARLAQLVNDEDTVLVMAAKEDGRVTTWSNVETEEQHEWACRRLDDAKDLVKP